MRILFICSSLEPSLDGVGDYVRRLARACTQLGHICSIIALHDRYVTKAAESTIENGHDAISILRIPSRWSWPERVEIATEFRSRFHPDVISFQVVPYGFDKKGILFGVNPFFRTLTAPCPLHIMFHELWIGIAKFAPSRQRLVGALQKQGVKKMISLLHPQWVTTSNPVYVSMLERIGVHATILPLFGNIPLARLDSSTELPDSLAKAGIMQDGSGRAAWWLGIFFGTLHPEWQPEPLMGILRHASRRAHKRVGLILAGRAGHVGEKKWEALRNAYRSDFIFVNVGQQPEATVSNLLGIADFGIAASPWQLLGKSGTVAAMLDHGLPVIVTRDDFQTFHCKDKNASLDPLVHRCDNFLEAKLRAGLTRKPARARLDEIASRFCEQLSKIAATHS